MAKKIICTVTNDLTYDQRMIRICSTLAKAGYEVELVGRERSNSKPLSKQAFEQKRLKCFFEKGKFFYLEYNIRLFRYLKKQKKDAICAVDLDTILPAFYLSKHQPIQTIYDAHEYFTEVPEVVNRKLVQRIWERIAKDCIPNMSAAYTVCESLATIFSEKYEKDFEVIRNVPFAKNKPVISPNNDRKVILYQGALNEGRGLEEMIDAMHQIDAKLWLAGEGDLSQKLRTKVQDENLENKVDFLGFVLPKDLKALTLKADIGLNLLRNTGQSYYYSLANKAFDYIQAELPALHMDFPEYQKIMSEYKVGKLLPDLNPNTIVVAINQLLENEKLYDQCVQECKRAKQVYTWENESKKLIEIYRKLFVEV